MKSQHKTKYDVRNIHNILYYFVLTFSLLVTAFCTDHIVAHQIKEPVFRKSTRIDVYQGQSEWRYLRIDIAKAKNVYFLLDTGAIVSCIDLNFAKQNKIDYVEAKRQSKELDGSNKDILGETIEKVCFKDYHESYIRFQVLDLSGIRSAAEQDDIVFGGILGLNFFEYYGIAMDFTSHTVSALDPFAIDVGLLGKWELVEVRPKEKATKDEIKSTLKIERGRMIHSNAHDAQDKIFSFTISPLEQPKMLTLYSSMNNSNIYSIYEYDESQLHIVYPNFDNEKTLKVRPKAVADKGNDCIHYIYRKSK